MRGRGANVQMSKAGRRKQDEKMTTQQKITRVVIKQNTSQRGKEDEWMTVQNERTRRMSGTGRRD